MDRNSVSVATVRMKLLFNERGNCEPHRQRDSRGSSHISGSSVGGGGRGTDGGGPNPNAGVRDRAGILLSRVPLHDHRSTVNPKRTLNRGRVTRSGE